MCLDRIDRKRVVSKAGIGYRLFAKGIDGELRSLFFNSNVTYEVGQWCDASKIMSEGAHMDTLITRQNNKNLVPKRKRYIPYYHIFTRVADARLYRSNLSTLSGCAVVARVSYKSVRYTGGQCISYSEFLNVVVAQKMRVDEVLEDDLSQL